MPAFVVKPREAWVAQATAAFHVLHELAGDDSTPMRELADLDHDTFSSLIEALFALGVDLEPELIQLARLQSVEVALDLVR